MFSFMQRARAVVAPTVLFALVATLLVTALPARADHDAFGSITVSDASALEGNGGGLPNTMTFTITIDPAPGPTSPVTVDYRTMDFTAESGFSSPADYFAAQGTVILTSSEPTAEVEISIIGDTVQEPNEFFTLIISDASAGHITDSSGTGTIINDDGPAVNIEDVDVSEGGGTASLTVSMAAPATDDVKIRYSTENGTATAGQDYTEVVNEERTIPAGKTEVEVTVPILQDDIDEANETFNVKIEVVSGTAVEGDATGVVTILDDDDPASVSIGNASKAEGEGTQTLLTDTREVLEFVVSVEGDRSGNITFDIDVQGVTATVSTTTTTGDFSRPSQTTGYTIEPTENSITIEVPINGDTTPEPHETLTVEIINLQGAGFGAQRKATGTILNDDATPQIAAGVAVEEGNGAEVEFTLSIPFPSTRPVTLAYSTSIEGEVTDTTTASDFVPVSGATVDLAPGQTSKKVFVELREDTIDEPDIETFTVTVTGQSPNASGSASAKGQILDDDAAPTLTVDSRSVQEGDGGSSDVAVTIRRSANSERTITYDVATQDGTARAGQDYTVRSQTGTFAETSSALTQTFFVPVLGDRDPEDDETVLIVLSNVTNGVAGGSPGVLTIVNDDENLGIDDAEVTEPDGSATTTVDVTVRLGEEQTSTVTVDYATVNGTATAGADYTAKSGTVTFPAGDTEQTISIQILGDDVAEVDETFTVELSNASSNIILADDEATVTIRDNDGVSLRVNDIQVVEGNSGETNAVFTVSLSNESASDVEFEYTTVDGTAAGGTAPLADDYETTSSSLLSVGSIPAGETSATITVPVQGDTDVEPHETFTLVISEPTGGATLGDDTGVATIRNDDAALSVADASVVEGNSGTKAIEFVVSIAQPSALAVGFQFDTANGTAIAGSDYQAVSNGSGTIPAGQTSTKITVNVIGDTIDEADEAFTVTLKNPTNATIADGTATGTIVDNDGAPGLSISNASVTEGNSGTVDMVFTVTLSAASEKETKVDFATADGSATVADGDYQQLSGTLTFKAGETVQLVTVVVAGDTKDEGTAETMRVALSKPVNATITDGTGIGTIQDDDGASANTAPTLEAGANRAIETEAVTVFTATVSDANGDTVVVTWNFGDGSAPVVGNPVSHAFDRVGLFTVNVTASDGRGGQATDSFTVNAFDTGVIGRSWGDDRILTAVAASQAHWPAGHAQASAHTGPAATDALIALADKYPDALAAGPLSAKLDAPLLLSGPSTLPTVVEDELERLGVDTVWLLGGPNSLSPAIEQRLKDLGYEVIRRSGASRFETAAAVAKEVGRNSTGEVVLTLGEHADPDRAFPDALSAGSLSASPQRTPLLLTRADDLPEVTQQALADLNTEKVWIVGGPSSVTTNVQARLIQLGYEVERLSGPGRYETSVDVAEEALSRAAAGPVRLVFATGAKFPDGLTGGAVAGRVDGILLLVPNGALPAATRQFLADNADRFDVGVILGGNNTLSESVRLALVDLMDN